MRDTTLTTALVWREDLSPPLLYWDEAKGLLATLLLNYWVWLGRAAIYDVSMIDCAIYICMVDQGGCGYNNFDASTG